MFALVLFASAFAQAEITPEATVKKTIDELVDVVKTFPGDQQLDSRRQKMRETIKPHFNFKAMSQSSLGPHWTKCSKEEQDKFVSVFSELLAKTYLKKIESIEEGMVEITGSRVKGQKAIVNTMVNYKDQEFPLDYKMVNEEGGWRIYDVLIENIGLVRNYRDEFAGIIRKEKFSGLMAKLEKKLQS